MAYDPPTVDARAGRGLDRRVVMSLALGDWIDSGHCVLITGPTGAGKSWLGCALAQYAYRRGHSAVYQRVPRMGEELRMRHGNGTFGKWLIQLARTDVLLLACMFHAPPLYGPARPERVFVGPRLLDCGAIGVVPMRLGGLGT